MIEVETILLLKVEIITSKVQGIKGRIDIDLRQEIVIDPGIEKNQIEEMRME